MRLRVRLRLRMNVHSVEPRGRPAVLYALWLTIKGSNPTGFASQIAQRP